MQIRAEWGNNYAIEFIQAPFGCIEPIGLLIEDGNKTFKKDMGWSEINEMFGHLKDKESFVFLDGSSISWDGSNLLVKESKSEINLEFSNKMFESFAFMAFCRTIDPY